MSKKKIEHQGLFPERLKHESAHLERAFARRWEDECKPRVGYNYGYGRLQDLLMVSTGEPSVNPLGEYYAGIVVNQKIATAAATVIQWLGTSCGMWFLTECLNEAGWDVVKRREPR